MIDIMSRWKSVTDQEKWAARGASFVAKAKATKAVWFPPEPVKTGGKTASAATKSAKKSAKKAARGSTRATSGAAKKATKGTKSVTPSRRKKT